MPGEPWSSKLQPPSAKSFSSKPPISKNHRVFRAAPHMLVYIEFGSPVTVAGDAVAELSGSRSRSRSSCAVAGRRKDSTGRGEGPYVQRKAGRIQLLARDSVETQVFASNPRFDRRSILFFCACNSWASCLRLQSSLPAPRLEHLAPGHFACAR